MIFSGKSWFSQGNPQIPRKNLQNSRKNLQNPRKILREFQEFHSPYSRIPYSCTPHSANPYPVFPHLPAHIPAFPTSFPHSQPEFPNPKFPPAPIPSFQAPAATPRRPEPRQRGAIPLPSLSLSLPLPSPPFPSFPFPPFPVFPGIPGNPGRLLTCAQGLAGGGTPARGSGGSTEGPRRGSALAPRSQWEPAGGGARGVRQPIGRRGAAGPPPQRRRVGQGGAGWGGAEAPPPWEHRGCRERCGRCLAAKRRLRYRLGPPWHREGAAGAAPPRLPARAAAANQNSAFRGRGFRAEGVADWLREATPTEWSRGGAA